jgi:YesN/AraC family two-component response regulator
MYGIYLVDDEMTIIEKLLSSIPWLEHGFEVIGYTTNSETAYTEIMNKTPDVVFSDLRMPVENDGIALLKRLVESKLDTEFIILTAYPDFKALYDFMHMDGFDYLLKPLEQEAAALVLEKLSRKLARKHCQTPSVQFVPSQSKGFDDLVKHVIANFNKKITLQELSEQFNLSKNYICNLFSKHYDSTLSMFVTELRMKEASRLILGNNVPLKEIAIHCGYSDYHSFCKAFKQYYGKPPSVYKETGG